ncbi:MAG: O-antigen ligase family protein [Planctomycetales bacterium]|nr:O-antigen ligase family protein [Planctomycetales bacterium]
MTALILLTAACVGTIWGAVFLRYAGLFGLTAAVLVVGTVFGHPFFHVSAITLDRLLLVGVVGLYALQRRLQLIPSRPWDSNDALLALFLIVLAGNAFYNDWRLGGSTSFSQLLFCYLAPAAIYWIARGAYVNPTRIKWMYIAFTLFGVYLGLTAVAEKMGWSWAVYPRYIMRSDISEFLGRGRGPLLNPLANGVLLSFAIACVSMCFPLASRIGKLTILGTLVVLMAGIYASLTRCVWLGAGLMVMFYLAVALPRSWRLPVVIMLLLCGSVGVGANWKKLTAFKRDKEVSVEDMKESARLRPILAVMAWKVFQDYPITGCGVGRYRNAAQDYLGDRDTELQLEKVRQYVQHNVFLSLLTETGLVGVSLFILLLVVWSQRAWRLWRSVHLPLEYRQLGLVFLGVVMTYFVNGMFHDVSIVSMVHMYLMFLVGLVRNLATSEEPVAHYEMRSPLPSSMATARWSRA